MTLKEAREIFKHEAVAGGFSYVEDEGKIFAMGAQGTGNLFSVEYIEEYNSFSGGSVYWLDEKYYQDMETVFIKNETLSQLYNTGVYLDTYNSQERDECSFTKTKKIAFSMGAAQAARRVNALEKLFPEHKFVIEPV